jgi:precorrin-6B methylase 1
LAKNDSNPVALVNLAKINLFWSALISIAPGVSSLCLIQLHCSRLLMNMNSTPMCLQ